MSSKTTASKTTTTTTKEKPVSKTKKTQPIVTTEGEVIAPVLVEAKTPKGKKTAKVNTADLIAKAVSASAGVSSATADIKTLKTAKDEAIRLVAVATFNATEGGVSVRDLETASAEAGSKVGKSTWSRWSAIGALLTADPTMSPSEASKQVNAVNRKTVTAEGAQAEMSEGDNTASAVRKVGTLVEGMERDEAVRLVAVIAMEALAVTAVADEALVDALRTAIALATAK